MRLVHVFLVLGFALFAAASLFPSDNSCPPSDTGSSVEVGFSAAPKGPVKLCNFCHSLTSRPDGTRKKCGHGFHIKCLHDAFSSSQAIEQANIPECCNRNVDYSTLIGLMVFKAHEFPESLTGLLEGMTYIPGLIDPDDIKRIWGLALKRSDSVALGKLLQIGFPTQVKNSVGKVFELILSAARYATPENFEFLLDSGIVFSFDPSKTLDQGFYSAMCEPNFINASILLRRGANINQTFLKEARTCLSIAVFNGNVDSVKFLIDNNADVNLASKKDGSPIHIAALSDNAAIVELLMKSNRVNYKISNSHNRSSVQSAACMGSLNVLRVLLDNGASSDVFTAEGYNLLHYTIIIGNLETVKFLINRGFDFATKSGVISYALHLAVHQGQLEIVKFLLEYGANPYELMTPPMFDFILKASPHFAGRLAASDPVIVIAVLKGDIDAFKLFLDVGTNPNTRIINSSCSMLHLAFLLGNAEIASLLISRGADIHNLDHFQNPPFYYNSPEFYNQVVKDF